MFGPSAGENVATGAMRGGVPMLGQGAGNLQSGANFFNTILSGNAANTAALLAPQLNDIRNRTQATLQATNTLMPRGGGRFATNYSTPFAANQQIGNFFNQARAQAPGMLANIGGTQAQLGTTNAQDLFNASLAQRQLENSMIGSTIGAGISGAGALFGAGGPLAGLFSRGGGGGGGGGASPSMFTSAPGMLGGVAPPSINMTQPFIPDPTSTLNSLNLFASGPSY